MFPVEHWKNSPKGLFWGCFSHQIGGCDARDTCDAVEGDFDGVLRNGTEKHTAG